MFVNSENEIGQLFYQNFNQKYLMNSGVRLFFGNVFLPVEGKKLPVIKSKLRKILVDFGLNGTHVEISQKLNSLSVYYRDLMAEELRKQCIPLRRDNGNKTSQAIELVIDTEGSLVFPSSDGEIRTYTGLTRFIYQEFIEEQQIFSLADSSVMKFYEQMKKTIQKGNLAPTMPLESILRGELG